MKKLYLVIFAILLFGIDDALIAAIAATVISSAATIGTSAMNKPKEEKLTAKSEPEQGTAKAPELGADSQAAEKRRRKGKSALTIQRDTGATGTNTAKSTGANI